MINLGYLVLVVAEKVGLWKTHIVYGLAIRNWLIRLIKWKYIYRKVSLLHQINGETSEMRNLVFLIKR